MSIVYCSAPTHIYICDTLPLDNLKIHLHLVLPYITLDHIHALTYKEVTAAITHTEVTPGHITHDPTEAHHTINTQILIITNMTHPIGGLSHIEALLYMCQGHILCTKPAKQHLLNLHPVLTKQH